MRLTRKQRAEAKQRLECAMCVGNRQLLLAIQQDVTAMRERLEQSHAPAVTSDELVMNAVRMEVAEIHPGDVLVVSAPDPLDNEQIAAIQDGIHTKFPGTEGIIIDSGMHINVIRPEPPA